MIQIILENIAKSFYPVGIDPITNYEDYIRSKEYNNLINCKKEIFSIIENSNLEIELLKMFKSNVLLADIENVTQEPIDRSMTFRIESVEEKILYQLCVKISVIVPYYTVYALRNSIEFDPYRWVDLPLRDNYSEKEKFSKQILIISEIVENRLCFNKFPEYLLNKEIENLGYSDIRLGKLTFFNAFFTEDYN